jgi:predicted HicB family RNase H-like nuclease
MNINKTVLLRIPEDLWEKLKYASIDKRTSINKFVTQLIVKKLKNYDKSLQINKNK